MEKLLTETKVDDCCQYHQPVPSLHQYQQYCLHHDSDSQPD